MLVLMPDAFAQAVEDARLRLSLGEGRNISVRELAHRAGVPNSTLAYNLKSDASHRRINRDLIAALARVLPIGEDELLRAARVAAGYQERQEIPDIGGAVVRFLNDEEVSENDKARLRARLTEILADEMHKFLSNHDND